MLNKQTFWQSDHTLAFNEDGTDYLSSTGARKIERAGRDKDSVVQDPKFFGKLNQVIEKLQSIRNDRRFNFYSLKGYDLSTSIRGYFMDLLSIPYNEEQKQLTIIDLSKFLRRLLL